MTDDIKYIITETNNTLGLEHNIISFDSMSAEGLLQLLIDVLAHFEAMKKIDANNTSRDDCIRQILEALQKVQYRPHMEISDPVTFRRSIHDGDKKVIYPILRYIFDHKENIDNLTYLARFLLPIDIPPEAMANPEIANMWNEYLAVMEEFKSAHKTYTEASKEELRMKELRNDLNAIEMEKANVQKRIDKAQARLDKVPQHELLVEAADALRVEKDRHKELEAQIEEQSRELDRSKMLQEHLERQLSNARLVSKGTTAQEIMESMQEEIAVLNFMVDDKLPRDIEALEEEIQLMKEVMNEPNITDDYIDDLRAKVEDASQKLEEMTQKQLAERREDPLIPFRQQAAALSKKNDMAAEHLCKLTKELREVEIALEEKQNLLRETVGEKVLRGEELKQYITTLRAKSSLYKQRRAELASIQAEVADLTQTLEKLKEQDPTLASMLLQLTEEDDISLDESDSRANSPIESKGLTELSRLIDGLKTSVQATRERIAPLFKQIRPLREHIEELQDELEVKKSAYMNLKQAHDAEVKEVEDEIEKTEKSIKELENELKNVQVKYERIESLMERLRKETNNEKPEGELSVKDQLQKQILEEQQSLRDLRTQQEELLKNEAHDMEQHELWKELEQLMKVKVQCIEEAKAKGIGGTLSIAKDSETFILNN